MTVEKIEQNQKEVKRTERGWAGHYCCSDNCKFRRNTLLECGDVKIVVSTVGAMYNSKGNLEEVGIGRHYETKIFHVDESTREYKDADTSREIFVESRCSMKWHKDGYIDNEANEMHENIVTEMTAKLLKGEL